MAADDPMARRYEQRFSQRLEDSMIQWLADDPMARRYEQRFSQRLKASMIQWLADDQLDALQSEVSASARGLDDAMVGCYNDEMEEKATEKERCLSGASTMA